MLVITDPMNRSHFHLISIGRKDYFGGLFRVPLGVAKWDQSGIVSLAKWEQFVGLLSTIGKMGRVQRLDLDEEHQIPKIVVSGFAPDPRRWCGPTLESFKKQVGRWTQEWDIIKGLGSLPKKLIFLHLGGNRLRAIEQPGKFGCFLISRFWLCDKYFRSLRATHHAKKL